MEYRYKHFSPRVMWTNWHRRHDGPQPGDELPDFELPTVDGGRMARADLLGRPALVHMASYT